MAQWADAIIGSPVGGTWVVHGPPAHVESFSRLPYRSDVALNLDRSLRSHLSFRVHEFVAGLVARHPGPAGTLELDAVLLAWGTDFMREGNGWSIERARRYRRGGPPVRNPWQLRANAYRVLLTRARDATVVYVPSLPELDATYEYLAASGFRLLAL